MILRWPSEHMLPRMPNGRGSLGINFDDINECSLDFHEGLQIVFFSWIFFKEMSHFFGLSKESFFLGVDTTILYCDYSL